MLKLDQAKAIIGHAQAKATEMKIKPIAVAVLDETGNIVAGERMDGTPLILFDVARAKAWGAVNFGASSRALEHRASLKPQFYGALTATTQGRFVPGTGAVLIRDADGLILGAAGASGATSDEDEACCIFGVEEVGLVADASET
jgi:uncharacterized protein GlcG (DUF336 family)